MFEVHELSVCNECIQLLANGGCDGCETCVFSDNPESEPCQTVADRMVAKWGDDTMHLSPGSGDLGYCQSECQGCGQTDHGDRFEAVALIPQRV